MTKILLVEDDKSLREIYGVRLYSEGYDIVSAGDGEEALAVAIKDRPALIVSDVMMPKISGFDMLDILRSTTETKNIKVIMMTALSSEDQRKRGEELGADRYLVKSQVGIEDVVRTVHEVLGDSPSVNNTEQANPFAAPAPTAAIRPAPTTVPPERVPAQPSAASTLQPEPKPEAAPAPSPTSIPVSQPPVTTPAPSFTPPVAPAPTPQPEQPAASAQNPFSQAPAAPQPQSSGLPQPTAPFSTQRPANLADRIIQPLNEVSDQPDDKLSSLMDNELDSNAQPNMVAEPTEPQQPEPQSQPAPQLSNPVQPAPTPQRPPQF